MKWQNVLKSWGNQPIPVLEDENVSNDDDLDDEAVVDDNVIPELLQEATSTQDPEDVPHESIR